MASIQKKGDSFYIVYRHKQTNGNYKQIWEKAESYADAKRRKAEIENSMNTGSYIPPSSQTVDEFLQDFVNIYGEQKWALSTYKSNTSLIRNYISPVLGKMKVQDITKRVIDKYYLQLSKTSPVVSRGRVPRTKYLTPAMIEKIAHLLASAMKQAVRWDILPSNPTEVALLPKVEYQKREIWLPKTLAHILLRWKQEQDKLREILQDDFSDYGLVITHNDGRPCENRNIETAFNKLKKKYNFPNVVFHSLRHSSTTYKLALSNGNIKDVQGDTGHATAQLVTDIYSHMLDESRKNNAIKFNAEFYSKPDLHVEIPNEKPEISATDLLRLLEESPELKENLRICYNKPVRGYRFYTVPSSSPSRLALQIPANIPG